MHIKDVESLVGMTQKNIRFYEKEGLLAPSRDAGNGYRTYSDEDVDRLRRVKLLRKLDVSLDDIRAMLEGKLSLAQGMHRHLLVLEQRQKNLATAHTLCAGLTEQPGLLEQLDAEKRLAEMEALEKEGVRFMDLKNDKKQRYHAAWIAALVFVGLMLLLEGILGWALLTEPLPLGFAILILAAPMVFVGGALLALFQRIKEIGKGEIDAYRNY